MIHGRKLVVRRRKLIESPGLRPLSGIGAVSVPQSIVDLDRRLLAWLIQATGIRVHRTTTCMSGTCMDRARPVGLHARSIEQEWPRSLLEWRVRILIPA
jgi:hypothetical protein